MEGRNLYMNLIERGTDMLALVGNQMGTDSAAEEQEINDILDGADQQMRTVGLPLENVDAVDRTSEKSMKEAALIVSDAKLINICCSIAAGKAESIDAGLVSYHPGLFMDNVVSFMEASPLFVNQNIVDWTKLYESSELCFPAVSPFTPMLGALPDDPVGPPREKKTRAAAAPIAETRRPINVTSDDNTETEDDEVAGMVTEMWNALRVEYKRNKSKPVCFFTFLIDPRSFGASVENMFYLSFLVKENRVQLSHDEDGLPVLTPRRVKTTEGEGSASSVADNEQMITSLCPDQWKELIELLDLHEPMFKPRGREILEQEREPVAGTSREN